jgi:hypothetical protein
MKRNAATTILAIIAVVAGMVAVIDTFRYMNWLFSPLSFLGAPLFGALLSGIVALIWFGTAAQLWRGDPRGWVFMVTIAALFLILDAVSLIAGTPIDYLWGSIVISALALILGLLPSTKAAFGTG